MSKKKPLLKSPRKIALVTWEDAYFSKEPQTEAEILAEEQKKTMYTVGFFIRETDKYVTLAMEHDETDNTFRDICRIRKENIREVQILD